MRFIADRMLGTLAKWLRVMGFDVVYAKDVADKDILELAVSEDRAIISRDRQLCAARPGSILIESTDLDEQILAVLKLFPPDEKAFLSRCLECNSMLNETLKQEAEGKVPDGVLDRHDKFWKCPDCGKIFWAGSHYQGMMNKARGLSVSRNSLR